MAGEWAEAFDLGWREPRDAPDGEPQGDPSDRGERRRGRLKRLRDSLARSRSALGAELRSGLFETLDAATWERLEEALIMADVGAPTTADVVGRLEIEAESGAFSGAGATRARLVELLAEIAGSKPAKIDLRDSPSVLLMVGVNGTGKTTTTGKLAYRLQRELGLEVIVAAADTYRAAAVEQLQTWSERAGCQIIRAETGGDAGAVVFDAIAAAQSRAADVVLCDTAGRLHNRADLMKELEKVRNVARRRLPSAPHEVLITIDATTGQNGLRQAKLFAEAVDVSGVVLTKLDGTAKGGIALAIARELGIGVKLIGVGEGIEDLRPFEPREYAEALLGE